MSNPQIHAFIQARLSSSRLKEKFLKKFHQINYRINSFKTQ